MVEENKSLMPVAEYNAVKAAINDGDISRLQTDEKQRLIITGDTVAPVPVVNVGASADDRFDYYGADGAGSPNSETETEVAADSEAVLCDHDITDTKEAYHIKAAISTINGKTAQAILRISDGAATPTYTILQKRTIHGALAPNVEFDFLVDGYVGDGAKKIELAVDVKQAAIFFADLHVEERTP